MHSEFNTCRSIRCNIAIYQIISRALHITAHIAVRNNNPARKSGVLMSCMWYIFSVAACESEIDVRIMRSGSMSIMSSRIMMSS